MKKLLFIITLLGVYRLQHITIEETINIIREIKKQYPYLSKIPDELVLAVIDTESSFNALAVRPEFQINDGSIGLMQLLTSTTKWIDEMYSLNIYKGWFSLLSPRINITLGMHFIYWLYKKCNGRLDCVIHSYNEGYGNYKKGKRVNIYHSKVLEKLQKYRMVV